MSASVRGWGPFPRTQLIIPAILAILITAVVIRESLAQGRLSAPPRYDDIYYLNDAAERTLIFYSGGMRALIAHYAASPPHSPLASGMAMVSFLLLGIREWPPYIMNSLLVFGFFTLVAYILRQTRWWERLAVMLALACLPLVSIAVSEFRPDFAAALFVAAAIILIIERPILQMGARRLLLIGALFAAALLSKPSTFPLTLALFVCSIGLAGVLDPSRPLLASRLRHACRAGLTAAAGLLLIAGPHFAVGGRRELHYIRVNIFGSDRDLWTVSGDHLFHARYYIDGPAGQWIFGPWIWPILGLALAGPILAARFDDAAARRRALVLAGALLGAYTLASINEVKQGYLGLPFQLLLLLAATLTVRRILLIVRERLPQRFPWAAPSLAILVLLSSFHYRPWSRWPEPHVHHRHSREVSEQVYGELRRIYGDRPATVFLAFTGAINTCALRFRTHQDRAPLRISSRERFRDFDAFAAGVDKANAVIVCIKGTYITNDAFPSAAFGRPLLALLESREDFRREVAIPIPETEHHVYIYRRVPPGRNRPIARPAPPLD
jgi:hypothetical protein